MPDPSASVLKDWQDEATWLWSDGWTDEHTGFAIIFALIAIVAWKASQRRDY